MRDIKCVCFDKIQFYTGRGFDHYMFLQPFSPQLHHCSSMWCLVTIVRQRYCCCWFIVCCWYHFVRAFCFVLGLWFSSTLFLSSFAIWGWKTIRYVDICWVHGVSVLFHVTVTLTSGLSSRKILKYCVSSSVNNFPQMCCMLRVAFVTWPRRMTLSNPLYSDRFSHTDKAIWAATWYFQQCGILTSVEYKSLCSLPLNSETPNDVQSVA